MKFILLLALFIIGWKLFWRLFFNFFDWLDDKLGTGRSIPPPPQRPTPSQKESVGHMTARLQNRITEDDFGNEAYIYGNIIEDEYGNKLYDIVEQNDIYAKDSEGHYHFKNLYK